MLSLHIHRFDETRRLLALRQAERNRFLLLCFGEKETAEIGRALRCEPSARESPRPEWLSLVERHGAGLEAATITTLVDGGFQASARVSDAGQLFDFVARPADALACAIRCQAPMFATAEVLHMAGLYLHPEAVDQVFAGKSLALEDGQIGPPANEFQQSQSIWLQRANSYFAPLGWVLISLTVFSTTVELAVAAILFNTGGFPGFARRLAEALAIYAAVVLLAGILIQVHRMARQRTTKLEVFPVGVRITQDKRSFRAGWTSFANAGQVPRSFRSADGLLYWDDHRRSDPGLALSPYERNWRQGEIGVLVRRYAPRLLGIQPLDPDGGRPIF